MDIHTSFFKQNITKLMPTGHKNDEVRYSLGIQGYINIRKSISIIYHTDSITVQKNIQSSH